MQITSCEIANSKYIQIYLTEEELEKQETKELIKTMQNLVIGISKMMIST